MPTGTTRSPALITSVVVAPLPTLTTAGLLLVTVTAVSAERGVRSNRTPSVAVTGLPAAAITRPIPGDGTTETPIAGATVTADVLDDGCSPTMTVNSWRTPSTSSVSVALPPAPVTMSMGATRLPVAIDTVALTTRTTVGSLLVTVTVRSAVAGTVSSTSPRVTCVPRGANACPMNGGEGMLTPTADGSGMGVWVAEGVPTITVTDLTVSPARSVSKAVPSFPATTVSVVICWPG